MAWIQPKTDWNGSEDERFEYVDYNRIVGNIQYLKELAQELFLDTNEITLGDEKLEMSNIYAREMNYIEDSLESINLDTYNLKIGDKQTYKANGSTPLWSEFNRIESASLLLFQMLTAHKSALPRLAFTLGGQKGVVT